MCSLVVYYVSRKPSRIIAISAIIALLLVPSAFLSDFFSDVGGRWRGGMAEKFEHFRKYEGKKKDRWKDAVQGMKNQSVYF